jgi:hypothetical protein
VGRVAGDFQEVALMVGAFAFVLAARALSVLPLMPLATWLGRLPPLAPKLQGVLVWGGLRGGIALALALTLPDSDQLPDRDLVVVMTAGVVVLGLLVNGSTIGPLARRFGLGGKNRQERFLELFTMYRSAFAAANIEDLPMRRAEAEERELRRLEREVSRDLAELRLTTLEQRDLLEQRSLAVELATYRELRNMGFLGPARAWRLHFEAEKRLNALVSDRPRGVGGWVSVLAERGLVFTVRAAGKAQPRPRIRELSDQRAHMVALFSILHQLSTVEGCPGIDPAVLAALEGRYRSEMEAGRRLLREQASADPKTYEQDRRVASRVFSRTVGRELRLRMAARGLITMDTVDEVQGEFDQLAAQQLPRDRTFVVADRDLRQYPDEPEGPEDR